MKRTRDIPATNDNGLRSVQSDAEAHDDGHSVNKLTNNGRSELQVVDVGLIRCIMVAARI